MRLLFGIYSLTRWKVFLTGSFERLKRDNPNAAHRLYGRIMTLLEIISTRKGVQRPKAEFVPDYNDQYWPEEADREEVLA